MTDNRNNEGWAVFGKFMAWLLLGVATCAVLYGIGYMIYGQGADSRNREVAVCTAKVNGLKTILAAALSTNLVQHELEVIEANTDDLVDFSDGQLVTASVGSTPYYLGDGLQVRVPVTVRSNGSFTLGNPELVNSAGEVVTFANDD